MTREEAKEKLKMILKEATAYENAVCYVTSDDAEALDMAIKALEQTEPEKCGDCVSRQAVIEWLKDKDIIKTKNQEENARRELAELPSVEPYRKPGKWIWNKRTGEYECSECGCNPIYEGTTPDDSEIDKYRYCRWCGAPMEVDE